MCFLRHPEYVEEKNRAFLQKVALKSIKRADLIITISSFTKQEIIDLTHTPEKKILVIDIPVDRSRFLPEHNRGPARLEERYGITKKYILTLGTVEPRKNIQLLIASYCLLPKEVRDTYSLVIAGKQGWKTSSLYLLIKQRRSQGFDIITTDYIDNEDTSTLYRNASAYAITTFYEGFGMPLLEALHCGVPTVATDIPVLREVAGEYSCLWSDFDPVHFRDQLLNILTDPELSRRLSENAAAQADRFSWDRTAKIVLTRLSQHNRE
jgi:glycosyltransferase involved in cell wall biosynthesis